MLACTWRAGPKNTPQTATTASKTARQTPIGLIGIRARRSVSPSFISRKGDSISTPGGSPTTAARDWFRWKGVWHLVQ